MANPLHIKHFKYNFKSNFIYRVPLSGSLEGDTPIFANIINHAIESSTSLTDWKLTDG